MVSGSVMSKPPILPDKVLHNGCNLYSSCFECPLPDCRYSAPPRIDIERPRLEKRNKLILKMRQQENVTVETIAERLGISERTVYKVLHKRLDSLQQITNNVS